MSLVIILSHVGTDFDGFASMALARKLYPGAHMVFPGRLGSGVEEFYNLHRRHFPVMPLKQALAGPIRRLIVVDTRLASRLGPFREFLHRPDMELHIYDHHPPTAESVRGDQEWVEPVGAAATLLVERCRQAGLELTSHEATLAFIAIHEETGSFRFTSTTPRDLEAAGYLLGCGASLEVADHFLRDPLTEDQRLLLEEFLAKGEAVKAEAGSVYLAGAVRTRSVYGLGLLASRILEVVGTDAVCAALQVGKETSIAARAGSDAFDMASWMQSFGGGGHRRAAAVSRLEEPLEEVLERLKALSHVGEGKSLCARDLMSTEVFSLARGMSVQEAADALRDSGHSTACLVDSDEGLVGLLSRDDLAKALDHGLGHAPATSVMTHKVVRVAPETPIAEVRRTIVERGVGTLPVIADDKLVGIISRSDLLREMYNGGVESAWKSGVGPAKIDLSAIGQPFKDWLDVIEDLAEARHVRLYAVGGFVRDTLLGRKTEDLDLVVEGDANALAQDVAKHLGGKVTAHEKYLTATVRFPDGEKLDLATARREVYCRPAALPEVAQSNLKSDLYRRDFTINSLAIRLSSDLQGDVIDFFGGLQDLESQVIRVLHNHSFFDDPSRILRAIRFEQRLGFTIEPHTRQLMKAALEANALALTRPERLKEEMRLALSESDPVKVLDRFEQLKVLSLIHPELAFKGKIKERTVHAMEVIARYPDLVPLEHQWRVPMMLLATEVSDEAVENLEKRFGWTRIHWPWPLMPTVGRICRRPIPASELVRLLSPLLESTLLVFASISNHPVFRERLDLYLRDLRGRKPLLTGHQILALGVPAGAEVARWKEAAFDAQLDGEFDDLESGQRWLSEKLTLDPRPV